MKMKILLTLTFLLLASPGAFAQAAGGAPTKVKIAIVDVLAFREEVLELKAKYDKLQNEFAPKYRDLESMQGKIAAQQKVLEENKSLTPQQAQRLTDEVEQLKKDYNRSLEDSRTLAQKREQAETEAIYEGLYVFDPDALTPTCGNVQFVLYSEKEPDKGDPRVVDPKLIQQIWQDFTPYRDLK